MAGKCLCYELTSSNCQDWVTAHLSRSNLVKKECWTGCDDCRSAFLKRGEREAQKCQRLKAYALNKKRRQQKLDDELDEYMRMPGASYESILSNFYKKQRSIPR